LQLNQSITVFLIIYKEEKEQGIWSGNFVVVATTGPRANIIDAVKTHDMWTSYSTPLAKRQR